MFTITTASNLFRKPAHWYVLPHVAIPIFIGLLLAVFLPQGLAADTLLWDAVNDDQLGGYRVYYGLTSRFTGDPYDTSVDVGNATNYPLPPELVAGATYYFAVRAYSADLSLWSDFSEELPHTVPITTDPTPTAAFSASPTSGSVPLSVVFTSTSSGDIVGYEWTFGDGQTSTGQNAVHTYTDAGSYTVTLVVDALATDGSTISDSETKTGYIVVTAPAAIPPTADFTATNTTGVAPLAVSFQDMSDGSVTSWSWVFGDGASSQVQHPTHTYTQAGIYNVSLTVTDTEGLSDSVSKTQYVIVEAQSGTGPVAAYGFEETDDLGTLDASGYRNDGVIDGATRIDNGRFGRALAFDGIDDWVTIYDAPALDLTDRMTLEAWVYPTTSMTGWQTVLMKEQPGSSCYYLFAHNPDDNRPLSGITFGLTDWRDLSGGGQLPANVWTHLAFTYDGSMMRLYVDGAEVASRAQTGAACQSDGALRLGGNNVWDEFFQGYIDEVRVYDRALSTDEIQTDMLTPVVEVDTSEDVLLEVGEIALNHRWQRVALTQFFIDPVVVAKPLSHNGSDPAVVRLRNVDATGFDIRIQEWGYLNGWHPFETVSYLVMERGSYVLSDGTMVQADSIDTDTVNGFDTQTFAQPFDVRPVMLAAITTVNDAETVTSRLRAVGTVGFEVGMDEQEDADKVHAVETISYIAWEPSSGRIDGLAFEVGRTANAVTDSPYTVPFQSTFALPPALLADMQTTDGGGTSNLRWANKTASSVDVWVDEEQSYDDEVSHTSEEVGYILFSGF